MSYWRLIAEGKNSASYNMAADAFLLEMAETGGERPVLRIYGWDQPSITIGYHQKPERAVNLKRLGTTPLVRRITGGRALLHDDGELTYAVAGNFRRYSALGITLSESYHRISQAILAFYEALGVTARISHRDEEVSMAGGSVLQKGCFAAVSRYEILVSGQKVAAGSQRRTRTSFIQHGTVRIAPPRHHPAILASSQVSENEVLGALSREPGSGPDIFIRMLNNIYNVEFSPEPFSKSEKASIQRLSARFENLNCVKSD